MQKYFQVITMFIFLSVILPSTGRAEKNVILIIQSDSFSVFNIPRGEWVDSPHTINILDKVIAVKESDHVVIVGTGKFIFGYSDNTNRWSVQVLENEKIIEKEIKLGDYGGVVVTNRRLLGFNGYTGEWIEKEK